MSSIQNDMNKAEILIEALPYIQRFNGNTVVVKYGGSAMKDEDLKHHVIEDVALLKLVGMRPIVVHGGGKEISRWVKKSGIEPKFYDGLRVTDEDTLEVAEMVLGKVNTDLVAMLQDLGVNAMGISGIDGDLLKVEKVEPDGQDIGYVGRVKQVNPDILTKLLDDDFVPVVFPIGSDDAGHAYNINGDHAAAAIAQAIQADKLIYLTDTRGVYRDVNDPETLISELPVEEAETLIRDGIVQGGMIPKVRNCAASVENGVKRVHILDGSMEHSILLEIFTDRGVGTAIMKGSEQRYYRGA